MDIGIIGGADGPTAIFVTSTPGGIAVPVLLAAAVIGGAVWFLFRKHRKR